VRAIIGIGNPGSQYLFNRHNVGFLFLDYFAKQYSLSFSPSKGDYFFCQGKIHEYEFSLIKPSTFVNNSGIAILQFMRKFKVSPHDLLVIHDDINIDFSKIKIKQNGSSGGHNGIYSIIYQIQSEEFPRIKIGIGKNFEKGKMADYVLSNFNDDEMKVLPNIFKKISFLVEKFILGGLSNMLNVNSKIFNDERGKKENEIKE
jgi:PTH1 family peptidyl-tRNA hydrolase